VGLTRELNDPLIGSVVAGRYRILKRLAAGGMGVVYEATQEPLGRRVALKVIRGDSTHDPVAQLRFEREAKTASSIQDPHVVVVYDFGALHDDPTVSGLFLAMEFVEGETLRSLLGQGRMTWRKSLIVVEHIARALNAAHGKGLVPRDLKPEHVMLTTSMGADM
jgi:serine/threonine-protein kinase